MLAHVSGWTQPQEHGDRSWMSAVYLYEVGRERIHCDLQSIRVQTQLRRKNFDVISKLYELNMRRAPFFRSSFRPQIKLEDRSGRELQVVMD